MFSLLLILHIVGICCWLGGAIYERIFIVGGVRKAKGSELEVPMYRLMLSTVTFFGISVLVILMTGIIMTIMLNYGFFHWSWIGLKQYMMVALLIVFMFIIGPRLISLGKQIDANLKKGYGVNSEIRTQTERLMILVDIAHLGVLFNLILGITRFF